MATDFSAGVLPLLQHIGLFAIIVVGYAQVRGRLPMAACGVQQAALGALFGIGAMLTMLEAVTVVPGVILDARTTMVALAALFGGPFAGFIAAGVAAGYRLWLGGAGTLAGVAAVIAAAAAGTLLSVLARRRRWQLTPLHLAAFGALTTLASLSAVPLLLPFDQAMTVLDTIAGPLIIANSIGVAFLGTLLRLEERHREAEAALALSEAHYRAVFDQVADCLFVLDILPDGRIIHRAMNPATEAALGVRAAAAAGRRLDEVLPPGAIDTAMASLKRCIESRDLVRVEETLTFSTGTRTWSTVLVPLHDEAGRVARILGTSRDITEQRLLMARLAAAKEQAEAGARAKADFLATMSHEIRTPMTGILGYATLLDELATSDEQHHCTRRLTHATRSLLTILDDILDFSRLEAGRLTIDTTPFDLREVIDNVVSLVHPSARDKGRGLQSDVAAAVPNVVVGDPARLRQVLLNLLTNAVKFTRSGGISLSVQVVAAEAEAGAEAGADAGGITIRFVVEDSGIGIPPEKQGLLFEKFTQLDASIARRYGGSGLGLAISKWLVEAMGGAIGMRSAPEAGSAFWFTLSLPVAAALPEPEAPAGGVVTEPRHRGRILLAEDVDMNQELVTRMLRADGHEVDVAGNGAEAVAAVQRRRYDLVLMDLHMPVMDGLHATAAIRALSGDAGRVPIVALTANVLPDEVERCRAAGMDDHLAKPIDRDVLLLGVQHRLRLAAAADVADAAIMPDGPCPKAGAPAVLDRPVLSRLEMDLGTEGLIEFIDLFFAYARPRLLSAEDEPIDWAQLRQDAHAMVSLAGNLGFTELVDASRALARACAHPDRPDARALIAPYRQAAGRALHLAGQEKDALEARTAVPAGT